MVFVGDILITLQFINLTLSLKNKLEEWVPEILENTSIRWILIGCGIYELSNTANRHQ
ncbi:hypothetical protein ABW20_dc0104334 [Dactylellina cionopaga]|nr:hypothetical protein ABW20_dc0104334 [Dactylellina cionopaga]